MEEIWKPINGYDDYFVSNTGKIKSYRMYKSGRILTPQLCTVGYLQVALYSKKAKRLTFVHRIIADYFIPNPENKEQVNHINGIKTDNRIENLEWVTRSENILHAFKTGLNKPNKGSKNGIAKLNEDQVKEIKNMLLENKTSMNDIAKIYSIDSAVIARIKHGTSWSHVL